MLNDLWVHTIPVPRTDVNRTEIEITDTVNRIETSQYETIDINVLRRGIIGINKVGYVF